MLGWDNVQLGLTPFRGEKLYRARGRNLFRAWGGISVPLFHYVVSKTARILGETFLMVRPLWGAAGERHGCIFMHTSCITWAIRKVQRSLQNAIVDPPEKKPKAVVPQRVRFVARRLHGYGGANVPGGTLPPPGERRTRSFENMGEVRGKGRDGSVVFILQTTGVVP